MYASPVLLLTASFAVCGTTTPALASVLDTFHCPFTGVRLVPLALLRARKSADAIVKATASGPAFATSRMMPFVRASNETT